MATAPVLALSGGCFSFVHESFSGLYSQKSPLISERVLALPPYIYAMLLYVATAAAALCSGIGVHGVNVMFCVSF